MTRLSGSPSANWPGRCGTSSWLPSWREWTARVRLWALWPVLVSAKGISPRQHHAGRCTPTRTILEHRPDSAQRAGQGASMPRGARRGAAPLHGVTAEDVAAILDRRNRPDGPRV